MLNLLINAFGLNIHFTIKNLRDNECEKLYNIYLHLIRKIIRFHINL